MRLGDELRQPISVNPTCPESQLYVAPGPSSACRAGRGPVEIYGTPKSSG